MPSSPPSSDPAARLPSRRAVLGRAFAASALIGGASHADLIGAEAGDGATWLRLVADLSGRPVFSVLRGDVWGFLPQADDLTAETFARRLYGYWGLLARQAKPHPGGTVALKTKAWSFYLDPASGAVIDRLLNPYTGSMVETKPLSGPVSTRTIEIGAAAEGSRVTVRRLGEHAFVDIARVSRFTSPDIAWFKLEADFNTHVCRAADLDDPALGHIPSTFSHNLVAEWQTWMKMHGAPGHILFRGNGGAVSDLRAAPRALLGAVDGHFPGSLAETEDWTRES